jgi:nucleotide-binding universal stress UspA family protein
VSSVCSEPPDCWGYDYLTHEDRNARKSGAVIGANRILVPVNGNVIDDEAVALACDTGRRSKSSVYAIYVIEVKRTLPLDVDLPSEAAKGDAVLSHAEQLAEEFGVNLETEILQARDVGTAIVDEALERDVDLIVMGIAYKRKFGDFDMGQTAPYVLKNAPCRVWLARAAPGVTAASVPPTRSGADRDRGR